MQGLGSATRTKCSLTELPSGIYAEGSSLDHPLSQRAWSKKEKEREGKRGEKRSGVLVGIQLLEGGHLGSEERDHPP